MERGFYPLRGLVGLTEGQDAPRCVAVGTGCQWKDPRSNIEALRHQHKDSIDRFHLPYFGP